MTRCFLQSYFTSVDWRCWRKIAHTLLLGVFLDRVVGWLCDVLIVVAVAGDGAKSWCEAGF